MKNVKIILTSILISIIFFIGFFYINKKINTETNIPINKNINSIVEIPKIKDTTIYFVGDIMLTRGVKNSVDKNFSGDYNKLFENIVLLKEADILFGNLEGDVSDVGNNVGSKYSFRMDPEVLPTLKNAGFDIVSFANNHIGDWNIKAFDDSLNRLEENQILKIGAGKNKNEAENPTIIEKNGVHFGFIGFSDVGPNWMEAKINSPGILLASDPNFKEIIKNAKLKSDVLIVSFHFGEEYKLIHNKRQETLAHDAIDNGADMVIGHHPHVMEDIENYKGKVIVYSLGNFIFDQYFSKDTMRGMFFSATFEGLNLKATEQKIISLNKKYQPEGIFTIKKIKEKDEKIKKDDTISNVCPNPKKEYSDMSLLNIGQSIALSDITYIPKNLIELNTTLSIRKEICLTEETIKAFNEMAKSAKIDGLDIKISSGFRSYNIQETLFINALKNNGGDTSISVAKPGYSEHQLGTTGDITGSSINYSSANGIFENTPEDIWLKENAYLFGFIQSYPEGKESITGYKYEPWHYRYLGIDIAKKIKESGLTITEFLK